MTDNSYRRLCVTVNSSSGNGLEPVAVGLERLVALVGSIESALYMNELC